MKIANLVFVPLLSIIAISDTVMAEGKYGIESNLVPFFLDGYHASVWYGKNGYRARVVTAKSDYPSSLVQSGFEDQTLTFYEVEFDIFFGDKKDQFRGLWIAAGYGRTKQEIRSETTGSEASIRTNDIHFGTGYTFEITNDITLNPWIGGAYHLNIPTNVEVGSEVWNPDDIDLVGGVKLGYEF